MNNELLDLFSKIDKVSEEVESKRKSIDDKRKEFDEIIATMEEDLGDKQRDCDELKQKYVAVDFARVLEELAKIWGVSIDDLEVKFMTTAATTSCKSWVGKLLSDNLRQGFYDYANYFYKIRVENINDSRVVLFECSLDRNAIQADGKPLIDHLHLSETKCPNGCYSFDFQVDDIQNIRIYPLVKNLYTAYSYNFLSDGYNAIINACEEKTALSEGSGMCE